MENYDLEIGKIIKLINREKAKIVLLQLPEGLKPRAKELADAIKEKTKAKPLIWLGECFGACDIPLSLVGKIELVIQFGHNKFLKTSGWRNKK